MLGVLEALFSFVCLCLQLVVSFRSVPCPPLIDDHLERIVDMFSVVSTQHGKTGGDHRVNVEHDTLETLGGERKSAKKKQAKRPSLREPILTEQFFSALFYEKQRAFWAVMLHRDMDVHLSMVGP